MGTGERQEIGAAPGSAAAKALALLAALAWAHYYLLHETLGPLTVDELYFAHVFWMLRAGLEQYVDFYSSHLPAYFLLLGPLVPPAPAENLSFVWALRATGLAAALGHVALLYTARRRDFPFLLPFLLIFLIFGRMTEIRPDTIGLLLFAAAWWLLIRGTSRLNMVLAALLAALALLFSARAAVMAAGLGLLLLWLCIRRRDYRTLAGLALLGGAILAALAAAYGAAPDRFLLVVRAVYLEPIALMPDLPLRSRILPPDRLLLLLLVAAGLAGALRELRGGSRPESALVIAAACITQLALVLFDPSPFQYVYGWAALPALAGIALLGRGSPARLHAIAAVAGAGLAAALVAVSLAQSASGGRLPAAGSLLRISYDAPVPAGELRRLQTPRLLAMAVAMERHQGLWNQLAILGEICRRLDGPVLTIFYAQPVCERDARHDWIGLTWPAMFEGQSGEQYKGEFEAIVAGRRPQLVAWGKQHYRPRLNEWGRLLLKDYDVYDGFALRRPPPAARD